MSILFVTFIRLIMQALCRFAPNVLFPGKQQSVLLPFARAEHNLNQHLEAYGVITPS